MKERLTGAIIVVALIVLLVPELLTGPFGSAPRANPMASSAEEPPLRSYTIKLADDAHPRGVAAHAGPEQPAPLATAPAGTVAAPGQPATEEPASPAAPPAPAMSSGATPAAPAGGTATAAAPAASAEGAGPYVVQLGSFASRANADRLARQVRSQGFPVSVSQGSTGHLYRVRVGPAHDRAAASELAQLLRARGHSGAIVPQ